MNRRSLTDIVGLFRFRPIVVVALGCCLFVVSTSRVATAQPSLLDGAEEEEAPLPKPPPMPMPNGSGGATEENPADGSAGGAAPAVTTGGGNLDDLLGGGGEGEKETVATERLTDVVICAIGRGDARGRHVPLMHQMLAFPLNKDEQFEFTEVDESGKGRLIIRPLGRQIERVLYYEQRMLTRAAEEFGIDQAVLAGPIGKFDLTRPDLAKRSARAAALLQVALAEHDSAVQRYVRQGPAWAKLREPLARALLNIEINQARLLSDSGRSDQALSACDRLLKQSQRDPVAHKALHGMLEELIMAPAEGALERQEYAACRQYLDDYFARFPKGESERAKKVRTELIRLAQELAERARTEKDIAYIEQAKAIWPSLSGLDQLRNTIVTEYPVLNVAYATLPRKFSPLSARTPVERHACSLLFEGLVRWTDDPRSGPRYLPQLAEHRPAPLARGRQFELPRCVWSDSGDETPHLCTAEDVVWTVQLLKKVKPHGFPVAWGELVKTVDTTQSAGNPFQFAVMLDRDYWQPLALMDFMVVPRASFPNGGDPAEIARFEAEPVGTGPYRLQSVDDKEVRFVSNPLYRKPGLPKIREIRFHQLDSIEARDAFRAGKIHVLYGARAVHVDELAQQGSRITKLDARSVYFLAPNYDNKALAHREFRMALANAIDREKILTTYFRPARGSKDHAALSGPYLAGSWASSSSAPAFNVSQAKTYLSQAKLQLGEAGVEIELTPIDPNRFHDQIVKERNFDLAYWRHDYDDETYWLWPLLDPDDRGPGGANFMHLSPDKTLMDLCHEMMIHKQFHRIQSAAHKTHEYFARNAPFIPLWQLNTYVALSPKVTGPRDMLDPIHLYGKVDEWELEESNR
jgi:hypothetical protein